MARIEYPQSASAKPIAPDVTYEDVRLSFLIRLHTEQMRLVALTEALESPDIVPASAFGDLEGYAHRLRGAAAVFDFPELRDEAKLLELAANAAVTERATGNEPRVQTAIRTLMARLTLLTGGTLPSNAVMALVPTN